MKTMNKLKKYTMIPLVAIAVLITGCEKEVEEVPPTENEEEVITDVKLIFTNDSDATDFVTVWAQDPDGTGVEELIMKDSIINLDKNKSYTLTFEIMNNLESPGEDIGEEIKEEDDEHQIFFGFTENAFSNLVGGGNINNSANEISYNDEDDNGDDVGLSTSWETSATATSKGFFTVRLQHQPDIKTNITGANDGDTDFELTFELNIN